MKRYLFLWLIIFSCLVPSLVLAGVRVTNMMSSEYDTSGSGIELYSYDQALVESYSTQAQFGLGAVTGSAKIASTVSLDTSSLIPAAAAAKYHNLAVGKKSNQSTTGYRGYAHRGNDANADPVWRMRSITHSSRQLNPWWQVDLGAIEHVGELHLYNRQDCCANRLRNFYVFISDTDLTGRSYQDILNDPAVKRVDNPGVVGVDVRIPIDVTGRYVRVQLKQRGVLSLAEVAIYAYPNDSTRYSNLIDLSTNKPTTSSSVADPSLSTPSKANDGILNGNYAAGSVFASKTELHPWWQLDLEDEAHIEVIDIKGRQDCCNHLLRNLRVFISNNDMTGKTAAELLVDPDVWSYLYPGVLPNERTVIEPKVNGRYVRVQLMGTGALELTELRVFGSPFEACGSWTSDVRATSYPLGIVEYDLINHTSHSAQISFDGGEFVGPDGTSESSFSSGDFMPYFADQATSAQLRVKFCGNSSTALIASSFSHSLSEVGGFSGPVVTAQQPSWLIRAYPVGANTTFEHTKRFGTGIGDYQIITDVAGVGPYNSAQSGANFATTPFSVGFSADSTTIQSQAEFEVESTFTTGGVSVVSPAIVMLKQ